MYSSLFSLSLYLLFHVSMICRGVRTATGAPVVMTCVYSTHALSVLDHVFQVLVMAGLNARGLQSKLLITPLK